MALSPFALTVLGMTEPTSRRRRTDTETETAAPEPAHMIPTRTSKRATSHYNFFQTACSPAQDSPPAYAAATKHKAPRHGEARDTLPKYTCTVQAEGKLLLQLESVNPLHGISESEWREVYMVLRGTLLTVHRVKDGGAGKILRSYTLQHAEIGLAPDSQHVVLVPQTRLAHIIPASARKKAWQRDPDMFRAVRQTILRLRVEGDQLLLADASEDKIHDLVNTISAAIDISCDINERSIPRQCTVPRRRRRQRPTSDDLNDPSLIEEQQRILREMYPEFAEQSPTPPQNRPQAIEQPITEPPPTPGREEDDLDFAVMREDFAAPSTDAPVQSTQSTLRPAMSRQTTASSVLSTLSTEMLYATSPANFTAAGKWQPPHQRTAAQTQRYARRRLPVLLAQSVRASDVLIHRGQRVKINWRRDVLEPWELSPPGYKAHGFDTLTSSLSSGTAHFGAELQRTVSQSSQTPSAVTTSSPTSSRVALVDGGDRIEAVEAGLVGLKIVETHAGAEKGVTIRHTAPSRGELEIKTVEDRHPGTAIHGVVFCF
ncbi:hypothetical protein LTR53_012022 [Teratosphaeriaceae sp. CCFEE 6253]|nr:hypothetical protein LTR53_012022 [Teratosphaeriaceae sp. CCFEE 6253]